RGALALSMAALLSKVVTISLPFALILLDVYPLARLPHDPRRWLERKYRGVFYEKVPFLAAALGVACIGMMAQASTPALVSLRDVGPAQRLLHALYGLAFYPWKTLLPGGLCVWYG